ncbi:MAG: TonB-dependent receptor plug domain-containing protein, partial [Prevotella sp.]
MHETEAEGGFEITVRVVSEQTGEPLVGAVVRCKGAVSPAITDAQGRCVCRFDRTMDKVKVDVSYIGYKGVSKIVSVSSDRTVVVQLKDDSRQLDNVVVTAQKRHTNALQQSSAISSETLERGGATSLAKLLETVPGVSSVSTGSTIAKPVIQGMHSSRILLMNNGVRLESQSWGADHAPELDYTGSSMVEVVKGAECIRYGFGAMGGVVLLNDAALPYGQTKPVPSGNVNIGYDTNARGFSGSGSIESGYKNFGLRVHGMYTRGGDYRTADYVLNNTGYNTISLSAQAGYRGRKFTATFFTSIYYQRSGIYYASKISDLSQLIKRFEYGRPSPETIFPFSYRIKPPFQQSQHVTMKGELKW